MKKSLLVLAILPTMALALEPGEKPYLVLPQTHVTSADIYNAALRQASLKRAAKIVFEVNAEDSELLSQLILTDVPGDTGVELEIKKDGRRVLQEISNWQKGKEGKKSDDYLQTLEEGRRYPSTYEWSVRRQDIILEIKDRYEDRKEQFKALLKSKRKAARAAAQAKRDSTFPQAPIIRLRGLPLW